MKVVVLDLEANGLKPTKIHCVVTRDLQTNALRVFEDLTGLCDYLLEFDRIVGHNILGYDWPVLLRLDPDGCGKHGSLVDRINDTLISSKLFNYGLVGGHSLEAYGDRFGVKKPGTDIVDWDVYTPIMRERCIVDTDINARVYKLYEKHINSPVWQPALQLEHKFARVCNMLHDNGFDFDIEAALELRYELDDTLKRYEDELRSAFPPKLIPIREVTPKETKSGRISRTGLAGDSSLYYAGAAFTKCELQEFNPGSHKQIIERLHDSGWQPTVKTKGHIEALRNKSLAKDKLEHFQKYGWKVCEDNLETLPEDAPEAARKLVEWLLVSARRRTLQEWFNAYDAKSGQIHGTFTSIGAWTQRMAHSNPNMGNTPSVDSKYTSKKLKDMAKFYGERMRSLWGPAPRRNNLQLGVDADGIQMRIFAHYVNDPTLIKSLVSGRKEDNTDVHSLHAVRLDTLRPMAKTYIYAWLLGAGKQKQASILGISVNEATLKERAFIQSYPGLAELKSTIIPKDAERGYFVGLDGRYVKIPGDNRFEKEHLALAGYLQNGEQIVIKRSILKALDALDDDLLYYMLVNLVHDEYQFFVDNDEEKAYTIGKMVIKAIEETGDELRLNCPLTGSMKVGNNWNQTH